MARVGNNFLGLGEAYIFNRISFRSFSWDFLTGPFSKIVCTSKRALKKEVLIVNNREGRKEAEG